MYALDNNQYYEEIDRLYRSYDTLAAQDYWPANQASGPCRTTEELMRIFGKGRGQARREELHPEPIIVLSQRGNHSKPTVQQAATQDQVSQQTHPLQPGETRVYPSMLADNQVPVLNLTESSITSQADLQAAFQSICLCLHGREESKEDENTE